MLTKYKNLVGVTLLLSIGCNAACYNMGQRDDIAHEVKAHRYATDWATNAEKAPNDPSMEPFLKDCVK